MQVHTHVLQFILYSYASLTFSEFIDEERMSGEDCLLAGLNSDTLKCSACRLLGQFSLEEILTDCLRCCEELKIEEERFPYAEMHVCDCNLHRFPQIAAFVRSEMKNQWGGKLKSEDGQTHKTLSIEKWDTDTVTEFLNGALSLEQ
uniref:15 kDa selenoprotein n=1 Tax=Globodera rostochiensis TaxID=31243 RepID=A0A914HEH2_GLORO